MPTDILTGRIRRTFNQPATPYLITLNVTDRCNCRCAMCDIHARTGASEISTSEIKKVLHDPIMKNLKILRVTGGEPFLRDDLAEIYAAAAQTSLRIFHLTTNASFPDKVGDFLKNIRFSRPHLKLQISLDAVGKQHDDIRGMPGLFDKVIATLNQIKPYLGTPGFDAGINQTVMSQNMGEIERVHKLACQYNLAHNIILGAKYYEGTDATQYPNGNSPLPFEPQSPMTREELKDFYRRIAALKQDRSQAEVRTASWGAWLRGISDEYLHEGGRNRLVNSRNLPHPPCTALFNHFRLLPDGAVIACTALRTQPAGNVRTQTISEIWRSPKAYDLRRTVRRCPGCWVECDIAPSAFFSGDILLWLLKKIATADRSFISTYLHPRWLFHTIKNA